MQHQTHTIAGAPGTFHVQKEFTDLTDVCPIDTKYLSINYQSCLRPSIILNLFLKLRDTKWVIFTPNIEKSTAWQSCLLFLATTSSMDSPDKQSSEGNSLGDYRRRVSLVPFGNTEPQSTRPSNPTPLNASVQTRDPWKKYSLSSYEHPHDVPPPNYAYGGADTLTDSRLGPVQRNFAFSSHAEGDQVDAPYVEQSQRRQGLLSSMMDWYSMTRSGTHQLPDSNGVARGHGSAFSDDERGYSSAVSGMRRGESTFSQASMNSDFFEPDDPRITGIHAKQVDDQEDLEKNTLRQMDYKARRKHIQRIRIQFNISCESVYLFIDTALKRCNR